MRLPWNRKYLEIGFHVILTAGVLVLLGAVVFHLSAAKNVILETARHVLAVFAPFFWSVGIAVVLEPLTAFWQRVYEKQLSDKQKMRVKNRRVGTGITYLLVFGVIAVLLYGIVHGLGTADLESLAEQAGDFTRQAGDWLVLFQLKLAEYGLLQNAEGILTTAVTEISTAIENGVLRAASILPAAGGQILNAAIGFAAAFYFLSEKENVQFFLRQVGNVFLGQRRTGKIAGFFSLSGSHRVFVRTIAGCGYYGGAFCRYVLVYRDSLWCDHWHLFRFFQPHSLFWCGSGVFAGCVVRVIQHRSYAGSVCSHCYFAVAAVGQCGHCTACGWKPRGTSSSFGVIIIGCFWWILWILGPFVRSAPGGAAEEFLFPFVRRKSHKTKGNLIFLCKNHFSL